MSLDGIDYGWSKLKIFAWDSCVMHGGKGDRT